MTYAPLGRLASSVGTQGTVKFAYSGSQMIGEFSSTGAVLNRYVYGPGSDNVLVQYDGAVPVHWPDVAKRSF